MTTTKDLLEAQAFERRRLVTAFVSGDGTAEPSRPGRTVLAGLVLAVLLLAGALVASVLTEDGSRYAGCRSGSPSAR